MLGYEFSLKLGEVPFKGIRGVVPGHIISIKGIEVDKVNVTKIEKSLSHTSVKCVRSFLRHVGFY